ncbi:hypothetical protein KNO15_01930 [Leifsonia shinshuensis]|uniref:hypothetical protein n=1 Tax=Leifsonia shinshuensis TaxID=150026 RepID=UPI001F504F26|nr:hypothetical protein [Leifsonia shinshuensis]MCI0155453.1 hypothetical protein [Leifsonia shinshuensis]
MSGVREETVRGADRPWWVIAGSLRRARTNAILYGVLSVMFGVVALISPLFGGTRGPWPIVLCVGWAVLAAWAGAGVWYYVRLRGRR